MKVAVITFIFPIAEPYYRETLDAIAQQTDQDFDTIVVDDQLNAEGLESHIRVIRNEEKLSLVALREQIFNQLMAEGYDLLISIDSDDTMSADRVAQTKQAFSENPDAGFFYSLLHYMREPKKLFFEAPEKVSSLKQILLHNFIGLSHMSLNLRLLRERGLKFQLPEQVVALDWYIASWYILGGYEGLKTNGITYYRLYENNLAGETSTVSTGKVKRILNIKQSHYEALLPIVNNPTYNILIKSELERLKYILEWSKERFDVYIKGLQHDGSNYWWAGY